MLTGDIHSNWVNDLKVDFRNADAPAVATEFVGTSITSGGDGLDQAERMKGVLEENPFVQLPELAARLRVVLGDPGGLARRLPRARFRQQAGLAAPTRASFRVRDGRAGAERL